MQTEKKYEHEILTMREEFDRMWEQKRREYSEEICSVYDVKVGDVIEYDLIDINNGKVVGSQKTLVEQIFIGDYCQAYYDNEKRYWTPYITIVGRNFLKGKSKLGKRVEKYRLCPKYDEVVKSKPNKIVIELETRDRITIIKNKNL